MPGTIEINGYSPKNDLPLPYKGMMNYENFRNKRIQL